MMNMGMIPIIRDLISQCGCNAFREWFRANENNLRGIVQVKSKETLLHLLCKFEGLDGGASEAVQFVCERNFPIDQPDIDGKTPLHVAAQFGNIRCAQTLLVYGANKDYLKRADWSPIMMACAKGQLEMVQLLISYNVNLHLRNKDGWTAFHIACRNGNAEIIRFLLNCDSKLWDTRSNNGRSPLHTAALHGCLDVAKILVGKFNYLLNETDNCGSTPFLDAIRGGFIDLARRLQTDESIYLTDAMGRCAIHIACECGQVESVHYLLTQASNSQYHHVNLPAIGSGLTPIHFACKEGHSDLVRVLVRIPGVDITGRDTNGRTAFDLAKERNHRQCVDVLVLSSKTVDIVL